MQEAPFLNRPTRNFSSNIQFTDQPIKVPIKYSFQNISQMKQLLSSQDNPNPSNDFLEMKRKKQSMNSQKNLILPLTTNQRYQTYTYKNTITQQNKEFKLMRMQTNPNSNIQKIIHEKQYKNWLAQNKNFSKPYSQMTKYVDNLSQNRNLIRRGPFNIPLNKDNYQISILNNQRNNTINSSISTNSNNNRILPLANDSRFKSITQSQSKISFNLDYKPLFKTKKQVSQSLNTLHPYQDNSYKNDKTLSVRLQNNFDRSLNGCINKYQTLIKMERNLQEDQKILKNSLNKIIAFEEIKNKINSKNLFTKDNLQKLKKNKKFKNFQQKYLDEDYNYQYDIDKK